MIKTVFRKYTVTTDEIVKAFNIEGTPTALVVDGVYLVVKTTTQQDGAIIQYKISPSEFMTKFKWTGDDARFVWEESKGGIVVEVTEMSLEGI